MAVDRGEGMGAIVVRPFRAGDGERLRAFWASIGMEGLGDDDAALGVLVERNPGLSLVAERDSEVVGSILGAWDGRRGWLYHVAVAPDLRRRGLAEDLVRRVEARLVEFGAPKVNAVIQDDNPAAAAFWRAIGYEMTPARQYGRRLRQG